MAVNAIDNANLTSICNDCGVVGFTPSVSYTVSGSNITVTDASTIPSGDTFQKTRLQLFDDFGGEVRGTIDITVGGFGYTSAPTVAFTGGGGTGATGTAVISGGKVTSVTIGSGGTGYTTPPTVTFTGGGGQGAQGTATTSSNVVTGVTLTAPARSVVLSSSTLDTSKNLILKATVLTVNRIAADGIANPIKSAGGTVGSWDVNKF
jgi:hypothetical protein